MAILPPRASLDFPAQPALRPNLQRGSTFTFPRLFCPRFEFLSLVEVPARQTRLRPTSARWLVLVVLCLLQLGCVTRRLTVRSNPPGAMVYIDDYEIGPTPVSVPYTYYGTRKIVLVKDGFETLTVMQNIPAPWDEWFPLDFISENVVPVEIRDQRTVDYNLVPKLMLPRESVRARGEELRLQTQGSATMAPASAIPGELPPGVLRNETLPPGARPVDTLPPPPNYNLQQTLPPPPTNFPPPNFSNANYATPPVSGLPYAPPPTAAPPSSIFTPPPTQRPYDPVLLPPAPQ